MFTVRAVALTGALVFMLGSVWAVFARSMMELIFSFGVLEGKQSIRILLHQPSF